MHQQAAVPVRSPRATLHVAFLAAAVLAVAAVFAPRFAVAQAGPGTKYIECLDNAESNLATCYYLADDRWRERMCNFAYYVDSIACTLDLVL